MFEECSNGVLKQQVVVSTTQVKKQQTYRQEYRCIWPPNFCVIFSKHIEQHMPKTCRVINHIHFLKGMKKPQCQRNHHPIFTKQA